MNFREQIIYQMAFRTFTPDGTIKAATKLLPHVASLGVDIVYICACWAAENSDNLDSWSERQKASETNNPKNPYKIADYYNVDEEYGTNDDLKEFVKTAHENGLKVLFDLVYLHCGRNAVFLEEHPDFVQRNPDGTLLVPDRWPFARINYESKELREYLYKNMEYFITDFGVDGFRCDVGDSVPLDFWEDSVSRLKEIKPNLIMINEGENPEYLKKAFDISYECFWNDAMIDVFAKKESATKLVAMYNKEIGMYGDDISKLMRTIDSHDFASDHGLNRNEITMTSRGVEAALVVSNTTEGIAFMWNGYEICDDAENCMFSNRFYGKRSQMNWSKGFTDDGKRRLEFIKNIHRIRHENHALTNGKMAWIKNDTPDDVISYTMKSDKQEVSVIVNAKNQKVTTCVDLNTDNSKVLLSADATMNGDKIEFGNYGYMIIEK